MIDAPRRRSPLATETVSSVAVANMACVQEWITAAIGVGGTLCGTGLGYQGALSISNRDRTARLRDQIRSALADYLGALYVSIAELRDLPPNRDPSMLDKAADAIRGEQGSWIARRRSEYRLAGDRYRELAGRFAAAAARLQVLPLHPDLESAVSAANDYAQQLGEDRTPELIAQWPAIRARLLASADYPNEGAPTALRARSDASGRSSP